MGRAIADARREKGLTQQELRDRLVELGWQIDVTALTRIENGSRALRVNQVYLIAEALDRPVDELIPDPIDAIVLRELTWLRDAFKDLVEAIVAFRSATERLQLRVERDDPSPGVKEAAEEALEELTMEAVVRRVGERQDETREWIASAHGYGTWEDFEEAREQGLLDQPPPASAQGDGEISERERRGYREMLEHAEREMARDRVLRGTDGRVARRSREEVPADGVDR